jgi:hypothetical protein
MKNVICILFVVLMMVGLCSCGNENWGIGNYTYTHVHIGDGAEGHCAEVTSWHDNELGIELHTSEFGSIYCSEGTYFLFEDGAKCPFCKE